MRNGCHQPGAHPPQPAAPPAASPYECSSRRLRWLAEPGHSGSRDNRSRNFFFFKSSVSGQKDSRRPTPRFLSADLNILLPTSDLVTWKLTWVLLSAVFHLLKTRYGARYHLKEMEFLEKIQGQYNDAQFWSSHLIERFNKFPSSTSKSESWFGSLGCLWDPNLFSSDCPLNFLSRGCFYYI